MTRRTTQGFTLLELLVTITLIGIVVAIAVPRMSSARDRNDLLGARREVASLLQQTRYAATDRGCPATWTLGPGANAAVQVTSCLPDGTGVDTVTQAGIGQRFGVTVTSTENTVVYSPVGVRIGTTTVTITFTKNSRTETLAVNVMGRPSW